MKAIVLTAYGSPDLLELRDVDIPEIDDNGILVEVHAASVNALDWHATRGMPYLIRMGSGLRKPKPSVLGVDLAGRVTAVGSKVTRFKPGDEVFGGTNGSFAEYTATVEDRLAPKPAGFTYEQAAALHVAAMTALQGLSEKAQLRPGQSVLINGAGGGVGTFAVQIAKWLGARVTAVTRTESVDLVRSLGADEVVDHRREDFTRRGERYDAFFDIGGNRSFADCRRVLTRDGILVTVGGPAGRWIAPANRLLNAVILSPFVTQRMVPFISRNDHGSLTLIKELAESGKIVPVIDRRFTLRDVPEAVGYVGAGHARGKVAITVR